MNPDPKAPDGDCLICAMEDADDAVVVARDDLWACEIVPGYEGPGWFVLRPLASRDVAQA